MAGTLKSLLVKLGVDSESFDKGMDHAEKRTGTMTRALGGLNKVGMGVLAGGATVIGGTGLALASTIKPATDLAEAINAVNVVFGDGAQQITDYGTNAAMAVGLSSREFNQMSAEMWAMLGNVGIAEGELGDETISLMERSSDMASIFNTDVSQAFGAIQSAIKGEFNPLEAFGVKMNQAAIDAKAMEMGLADSNGELDNSAKAQAALALVYEQTDKYAGDFQNTSDGLANSQRQLTATVEDVKAKIGGPLDDALAGVAVMMKDIAASPEFEDFLNGVIESVGKLADWITKTVPKMIAGFRKFSGWLKDNRGVVIGILAALGAAVAAFVYVTVLPALLALLVAMWPVLAVMAAVAAVAYLVYEAWTNNWGGIQEKVALAKEFIVNTFNKLKDKVIEIWNTLMTVIQPIIDAFTSAIEGDWYSFGENLRTAWDNMWGLIKDALSNAKEWLSEKITTMIDNIITFFTETDWKEVGLNIIKGIAKGITNATSWLKDAVLNAAKAAWDAAKGFLGIDSPSKLFAGIGQNMMLGMGTGIDDYARVPEMATAAATSNVATTAGRADYSAPAGSSQPVLDEAKLARMLRDLMLAIGD